MIEPIDFTDCERLPGRAYNGANGKKMAGRYDGDVWLLKFPPSTAEKPTTLSYSNSCYSEHVAINILYDKIKPSVKRWVSVLNYLEMFVVDVLFIKYGWAYTVKMGKQLSMGMEIPMKYMYGVMPVCGVICAVCIIIKLILAVKAPLSAFEPKDQPVSE